MARLDNPTKDQLSTIRAAREAFKTASGSLTRLKLRGKAKRKMRTPVGLAGDGFIEIK